MKELGAFNNSPLRYPGSKSRRAVRLLRLADQSKRHYVEPFAGGLGMLFRARRERLFRSFAANDANENLINFYTILRDYPADLLRELWSCYQANGSGDEELLRSSIEDLESSNDLRRAVAFFLINKLTVRGILYPTMVHPTIRHNGISPAMLDRLPLFSDLLSDVKLTCVDYRCMDIPKNSFVFMDPPYEGIGAKFYQHRVDLQEFSDWAKNLHCSWLIILNDSQFTNKLFSDYDRIEEPMKYHVVLNPNVYSNHQRIATELVIMNYHRPTRDAFVRQLKWKIKPAKEHPARCSKRAG